MQTGTFRGFEVEMHDPGIALTGIKGVLRGGRPGPTAAVLGELDSLRVPGHPHADGETGAAELPHRQGVLVHSIAQPLVGHVQKGE